jgi:lipopolysaccharide transport system permease protein
MFGSPVIYPSAMVPERWQWLFGLNPMAGVIEGFRWSLTGAGQPPGPLLAVSCAVTLLLLLSGLVYFQKMEANIADIV